MRRFLPLLAALSLTACSADMPISMDLPLSGGGSGAGDGRPVGTLRFFTGWNEEQRGALIEGGHLVVDYDLHRLPECFAADYNGYAAWDTIAYVRFLPGGQLVQGSVKGYSDHFGQDWYSQPLDVDVPAGAREAQLWFLTSGYGCTSTWDSDYGQNYRYEVLPVSEAPQPVGWVGDFGSSFTRDCTRSEGVPDPAAIDEWVLERACMFVEADVWVPGLTEQGLDDHHERLQAQVVWREDGGAEHVDWLDWAGRADNNARWRWEIPRQDMVQSPSWQSWSWRFRFSTDGVHWSETAPRTLQHVLP